MKAQNDIRVTVRVDRDLKENAESLFERLGMNMSTAFNVFLRKAVDESAIPFPVSVKPAVIGYGLSVNDVTNAFTAAVQDEMNDKTQKGLPVARYDAELKKAYLETGDGVREYING
jgi:addiction module RelB/DinJ family antitoxin